MGTKPAGQFFLDAPRLLGYAAYGLMGLVLLYAVLAGLRTITDADTGWQLASGRYILQHHQIPTTDVLSYTARGAAWIYPALSEVLLYLLYLLGGFAALSWLNAAACAATVADCLFWRRRDRGGCAGDARHPEDCLPHRSTRGPVHDPVVCDPAGTALASLPRPPSTPLADSGCFLHLGKYSPGLYRRVRLAGRIRRDGTGRVSCCGPPRSRAGAFAIGRSRGWSLPCLQR